MFAMCEQLTRLVEEKFTGPRTNGAHRNRDIAVGFHLSYIPVYI